MSLQPNLWYKKHWTHFCEEYERHRPNELRRLEAYIKDKIEKLKAEHRRQNTLPKDIRVVFVLHDHGLIVCKIL